MTPLSPLSRLAHANAAAGLAYIAPAEARDCLGKAWGHPLGGACPPAWIEREALALAARLAAELAAQPKPATFLGRPALRVIDGGKQ
jgi:hypothetical protein